MPCRAAAKMDHLKVHGADADTVPFVREGKGREGRQSGRVARQGSRGDYRGHSFGHCRDMTGDVDYARTLPYPESHEGLRKNQPSGRLGAVHTAVQLWYNTALSTLGNISVCEPHTSYRIAGV